MAIRFKCPHCKKPLAVKDHLAGKKAACPACKNALVIPTPVSTPADAAAPLPSQAELEAMAAAALAEDAAAEQAAQAEALSKQSIDFNCPQCDEEIHFPVTEAGKRAQCPECRQLIKVPVPNVEGPKDWRAMMKKGPSAALINQPEQLEDAWGTEVKTRVSGTALQEAGALPDIVVEPIGIAGWIRRGFYVTLVLGAVFFLYTVVRNRGTIVGDKNAIKEGLALVEPTPEKGKGPSKSKVSPLPTAEVYRSIAELYLGQDPPKRANSLDCIRKARYVLLEGQLPSIDHDLFLAELCRSIVELGGVEEDYVAGTRYLWTEEVQTELLTTLQAMQSDEGKAYAMRLLGTLLIDRKQPELAWSLATALMTKPGSRVHAQQVALLVGTGKNPPKDSLQPPELEKIKGGMTLPVRIAFAEANARKGDYALALQVAQFRGKGEVAPERLEACLGAAQVILDDPKKKEGAKDAAPFFQEAVTAYNDYKGKAPSWLTLQFVRVGALLGEEEKVKEASKRLDGAYRNRAQIERLLGKLARSTEPVPSEYLQNLDIDTKADKDKTTLALAWSHLARHNGRLGAGKRLREEAEALPDENLRPFIIIGTRLGEQDAKRR